MYLQSFYQLFWCFCNSFCSFALFPCYLTIFKLCLDDVYTSFSFCVCIYDIFWFLVTMRFYIAICILHVFLLFSLWVVSVSLWPYGLLQTGLLVSLTISWNLPKFMSKFKFVNWCCYPTISSSATLFSFSFQFFPASEYFPMSQLFASGGQKVLELQLHHQSFQWIVRIDFL